MRHAVPRNAAGVTQRTGNPPKPAAQRSGKTSRKQQVLTRLESQGSRHGAFKLGDLDRL